MADKLKTYRQKRNFDKTAEPDGYPDKKIIPINKLNNAYSCGASCATSSIASPAASS